MAKPVPTDSAPIVGETYLVPCVRLLDDGYGQWPHGNRWWPTIGPKHDDSALLKFKHEHYHVDWRFVGKLAFEQRFEESGIRIHAYPVCVTRSDGTAIAHEIKIRTVKCQRSFVPFPDKSSEGQAFDIRRILREAYADCPLKPGLICPHKGIALAPFADSEGIAICPGHGLAWNLNEKRLATDEEECSARGRLSSTSHVEVG